MENSSEPNQEQQRASSNSLQSTTKGKSAEINLKHQKNESLSFLSYKSDYPSSSKKNQESQKPQKSFQVDSQQVKRSIQNVDLITDLKNILQQAGIDQEEDLAVCIKYFEDQEYNELQFYPSKKYRSKFKISLDSLIQKRKALQVKGKNFQKFQEIQEINIEEEFRKLLKSVKIEDDEEIKEASQMFEKKEFDELIKLAPGKFRKQFGLQINLLIQKIDKIELKKAAKEKQLEQLQFDWKKGFNRILKQSNITEAQEIQLCHELIKDDNIYELKIIPKKQYREQFDKDLTSLLQRMTKNYEDKLKEMITFIFSKVDMNLQAKINEGVALFKQNDIEGMLGLTAQENQEKLRQLIEELKTTEEIMLHKEKTVEQIFFECQLEAQFHNKYKSDLERGDFQFLLKMTQRKRKRLLRYIDQRYKMGNCSMEVHLRIILSRCLNDEEIQNVLELIRQGKGTQEVVEKSVLLKIEQIEKEHQIIIHLKFERNKKKDFSVNQIFFNHKKEYFEQIIVAFTKQEINQIAIFEGEKQMSIEKIDLKAGKQYILQLYRLKTYTCKFNEKNRKISLVPLKSMDLNKSLIFSFLQQKKYLEYNQQQPFDFKRMSLKFQINKKLFDSENFKTIQELEQENGEVSVIFIEIRLKIVVFYENQRQQYDFLSQSKLQELREIINQKHMPFQSQILSMRKGEQYQTIDEANYQELFGGLSSQYCLSFLVENGGCHQFYGFTENFSLSFEGFSQFLVEDDANTEMRIKNCSFDLKCKESEEYFIKLFFSHLYSGIKKRFPIKAVLDKFKSLVSKISKINIWNPKSENGTLKVNESFVLCYLLKNADQKLKIELMNLLRENMAIPLYIKDFQNISKVVQQKKPLINQELLWIMKEGFTIASVGFHTKNVEKQKGKSSLLNEIFPTHFEQRQNKHCITKGIPYIALSIFQNIYPLHIIDIPHDTSPQITSKIVANVDMLIVHSWISENQTQKQMLRLKQSFQIPMICLLRDDKDKMNSLQNLSGNNIAQQRVQKIINIFNKQSVQSEINLLKDQIYYFIKEKSKCCGGGFNKIFGLYKQNTIYQQFSLKVAKLKEKMLYLSPVARQLNELKKLEKMSDNQRTYEKKKEIQAKFCFEIQEIVKMLIDERLKMYQHYMLNFLRERLTTYKNELIIKCLKIYDLRDRFKQSKDLNIESKSLIVEQISKQLNNLIQLQPQTIIGKSDNEIIDIIQNMAETFETKVKPNIFSIELFWRELNCLINLDQNYKIGNHSLLDTLKELKQIEINSNLPFQIIDGDMLQMPKRLMTRVFENKMDKTVVITILGPQSSGKSTLLNFLFGCDFAASEGRCTRGVYGTYFKFTQNIEQFTGFNHCQGIFVIDTEGLFAITNKTDQDDEDRKNFDSKLVLFCLAVSDFVIINVRGNLDKNTQKMIRICNQRLVDLNIQDKRKPQIIVVLNQNNSDSKQESENEFKQIKKTIEFDLSKSLSLAYRIDNFNSSHIKLFDKNQNLSKKYPLKGFLAETTNLMGQIFKKIMKKRNVSKLSDIIKKFELIWITVMAFPNLSKAVTDQYLNLQKKIKNWKDQQQQIQSEWLNKMIEDFNLKTLTQDLIIEEITLRHKDIRNLFDQKFKEVNSDDDDIKFLIRQERTKIISKEMLMVANAKYELQNIKLKKQLNLSKIEGDCLLREKAKQICAQNQNLSEEQKKKKFDKYFKDVLERLKIKLNMDEEIKREYNVIEYNYNFLIKELTGSEKGLPIEKNWIGDEKCSVQKMLSIIKNRIIEPHQRQYDDVLMHTNRIHTDVLKGGKTDALLQYFSMQDYFKEETITKYYTIQNSYIQHNLKKDILLVEYQSYDNSFKKQINISQKLRQIWMEINKSLKPIGLQFTQFNEFEELFKLYKGHKFARFKNFLNLLKLKINYQFLKEKPKIEKITIYMRCNQYYCPCNTMNKYHQFQTVDHEKHQFSRFLNQYIDKTCLCYYNSSNPQAYLLLRFYQHINWQEISNEINNSKQNKYRQQIINDALTNKLNQDLANLNIRLSKQFDWKQYFESEDDYSQSLVGQAIKDENEKTSQDEITSLVEESIFIKPRIFNKKLSKWEKKDDISQRRLCLFSIKTKRLEPIQNDRLLGSYVKDSTKMTIYDLKRSQFKRFIFPQLQTKKRCFDKFFNNVFNIVENVLIEWKNKVEKKTLIEIHSKVNQQICKINNDLNQISCNLSETYIGYINRAVVYMIWKLIIDKKIKEKTKIYEDKQKEYESEWNLFNRRTSNIGVNHLELDQFIQAFCTQLGQIVIQKKQNYMKASHREFQRKYTRDKVQTQIDKELFEKQTNPQQILKYLENPSEVIENKYYRCYQQSWKDVQFNYITENTAKEVIQQFYNKLKIFSKMLSETDLPNKYITFSDIFQIVNKEINAESQDILPEKYQSQGKRVLHEYFIDVLLNETPEKIRKCVTIDVKLKIKMSINFMEKASEFLKIVLQNIKKTHGLSITNLVNFTTALLAPEIKERFRNQISQMNRLTEQDKLLYINQIKVLICKEKCPCCGRICGHEGNHMYHSCLYGHQMRCLNGSYIKRSNNVKEASVIRCQQMCETDFMEYNGNQWSWTQFKHYWKNKKYGGWLFDDATLKNDKNKQRFQIVWAKVGQAFCNKNGLKYVSYNQSQNQQRDGFIHYIFALDESGSMNNYISKFFKSFFSHYQGQSYQQKNRTRWDNLMISLEKTIDKLKAKKDSKHRIKVSLLKFNQSCTIVCQNKSPSDVPLNLSLKGGDTNFELVFCKAAEIASKYIEKQTVVFIFMTDGKADFPLEGIKQIKHLQSQYPGQFIYFGIEFQSNTTVMKIIANQLKGTNGVARNAEELTSRFAVGIEIIQFREGK